MRYLVTGGAGFIGCNLVERLLSQGADVLVLDDLSRQGSEKNLAWLRTLAPFEFINCDIRDRRRVEDVFVQQAPIDVVFHLAAQVAVTTSITDPRHDFEVNLLGTLNILEAVRQSAVRPALIYSSTNKVYGKIDDAAVVERHGRYEFRDLPAGVPESMSLDFYSPYGCSKGGADQYVRDYSRIFGLRSVVLRQSCIYGQRQLGVEDQGWVAWFVIAHALGVPLTLYGDGKQVRDLLHIDDLIDLYMLSVERMDQTSGQVYNVGGGPDHSASLLEVIDHLERLSGRRPRYSFDGWRQGDQPVFVCDLSRVREHLGWAPRISVEAGIARLYRWVEENKNLVQQVAVAGR